MAKNKQNLIDSPRVFFFHYNKPASKRFGRVKWSVHQSNVCYIVDGIVCNAQVSSKSNKRQPFAIMKGIGKVTVRNNIAVID